MSLSHFFRVALQRVRSLFQKDALDTELSDELAFHYDQLVREHIAEGMTDEQARRAARVMLGNAPLIEEQCRDQRGMTWFHDVRQDVVYGLRMLRNHPGFTAVAAASLALGIGANAAILGTMDTVLRDRLPMPNGDRLTVIGTVPLSNLRQRSLASVPDYFAWQRENQSFDAMAATRGNPADVGGDEEGAPAERLQGQASTANLFSLLGVQPLHGRVFTESDDRLDNPPPVVVISHRLWQRRFGEDPEAVGSQLRVNGVPLTIIGVMPPAFQYPSELVDFWMPVRLNPSQLYTVERLWTIIARLKPGVTVRQAHADLAVTTARLARDDPERHGGWGVRVDPLREALFGWTTEPLLTLEAAVLLCLLVACANVAGLLLARGSVRGPEMAVRVALGAPRGRIIRQLLTESLVLAGLGGALGTLVAWAGLRGLGAMTPPLGGRRITELPLNGRILGMIAAISIVTAVVFGLVPALSAAKTNLTVPLKESAHAVGAGRRPHRVRDVLVAGQIVLTFMLLIGAGLLMKSFVRLADREIGFDPKGLLTFDIRMPVTQYLQRIGSFRGFPYFEVSPSASQTLERVHERLRNMPGVDAVAGISHQPVNNLVHWWMPVTIEGRPSASDAGRDVAYFLVTPDFFTVMRTPLIRGRDFDARDTASAPWVAIVNETTARRFWPGQDPIGQQLTLDVVPEERPRQVIGVIRDIPLTLRQTTPSPVLYASYLQQPARYRLPGANLFGQMTFMLRTSGDPMRLIPAARRAVAEVDPDRPLAGIAMVERQLGNAAGKPYYLFVLAVFAVTAMSLAAIGIYGVMSYAVAHRTHEIGIRIALGARLGDIAALVGRQAVLVIASGLGLGLVGSLALTQLLRSQLWGVTPTDVSTFIGVTLLLACVALLACFVPARRAIRVNPTVALRIE